MKNHEKQTDEAIAEKIKMLDDKYTEELHINADQILLDLLRSLGYVKTVEAFQKLYKWYA